MGILGVNINYPFKGREKERERERREEKKALLKNSGGHYLPPPLVVVEEKLLDFPGEHELSRVSRADLFLLSFVSSSPLA